MNKKRTVVEELDNYLIVEYYANTLYTNDDKETGNPYYGDIYSNKEEVLVDHPDAEILQGFGFIDKITGYQPDETPDWFDSVEEVKDFIDENL